MAEWISLDEALAATGLRIAPVRAGMPSPWSELCKALFRVKGIPFVLVSARDPKGGLAALRAATGQESLPVVFWNDERPRASWLEQLMLAERVAPEPALLPASPRDRAAIIGLLAELCAEEGFGWHRRHLMIERLLTDPAFGERERAIAQYLGAKYGYAGGASLERSRLRCEAIVAAFVDQQASGGEYLSGDALTALDLGWAAFAALIRPLPTELCPMDPLWRELCTWTPRESAPHAIDRLLAHRDRIYRERLELPVVVR